MQSSAITRHEVRTRNSPTEAGLRDESECDDPGVQVPSASTTFSRGEVERFGRRRSRRARRGEPGDGRQDRDQSVTQAGRHTQSPI